MAPLYRLRGIRHRYGVRPVLAIDALEVEAGAVLGVVGPNGSGKSTLLKLMSFVEAPSAGEIRFKEKLTDPFAGRLRDRVALLPQEPFLLKRDVAANIAYGLRLRGEAVDPLRVREALGWVGLDAGEFTRRSSHALSGGEAQRVALAARLILRPEALLLDEPTTSVDAFSARLIRDAVLRARADWGTTLVIASHDRQWLAEISDTRLHLFRGRVTGSGRENLLFGPWRPLERGWGQLLDDGQRLRVPEPPAGDAIAVLERLVSIPVGDEGPTDRVVLHGTVARMALENSTSDVLVEVRIGGLAVTLGISPECARGAGLFPGGQVSVGYDLSDVKWMPSNGAIRKRTGECTGGPARGSSRSA